VAGLFAEVRQPRLGFVGEHDPRSVSPDGDHPRPADFTHRPANPTETVILRRTITIPDPLARANVAEALAGPGAPAGVTSCTADGASVTIAFDASITSPELIDALIAIETAFVAARAAAFAAGDDPSAIAACGLNEPELDATRIIEKYLP